jgi:hypothetical protein
MASMLGTEGGSHTMGKVRLEMSPSLVDLLNVERCGGVIA